MKTTILTEDALGRPIYTFTVTFTEVGGEGRQWSGKIRETDDTIVGQWPRAVNCLTKHFDIKTTPIDPRVRWERGKITMTLKSGETLEIPANAHYWRNRIEWKHEVPLDPAGRVSLHAKKRWVGRVAGKPAFVVQKVNGRWQSSSADWHDVSTTREEAFEKCERRLT